MSSVRRKNKYRSFFEKAFAKAQEVRELTPQEQAEKQLQDLENKGVVFGDSGSPSVITGSEMPTDNINNNTLDTTLSAEEDGSLDELKRLTSSSAQTSAGFLGGLTTKKTIRI